MDDFLVYAIILAVVLLPDLLRKRKRKGPSRTEPLPSNQKEEGERIKDRLRHWEEPVEAKQEEPTKETSIIGQEPVGIQQEPVGENLLKQWTQMKKRRAEVEAALTSVKEDSSSCKNKRKERRHHNRQQKAKLGLVWSEILQPPLTIRQRERGLYDKRK